MKELVERNLPLVEESTKKVIAAMAIAALIARDRVNGIEHRGHR